ncbi:hypothetical protein [Acidovorax delafieldii]|uniref:hypothetical protein n=1 Tax=Acidovorax delafieldii TaxID=47920 RepID=UPI00375647A7
MGVLMGQAVASLVVRRGLRGGSLVAAMALAAVFGATGARPVAPASAASVAAEDAAPAARLVYTRARLVSVGGGCGRPHRAVRLKLLPRAKLPFTTQTFRVVNPALLHGIPQGAWVQFTARHIDGENALTSIRATAECKRFERCD